MGSFGIMELWLILVVLLVPVAAVVLAYRFGKKSGEHKILKQMEEDRRKANLG